MAPMSYPLRVVLHKQDASGHLVKWAIEFEKFDISYVTRTTVKAQALADFLVEFCQEKNTKEETSQTTEAWTF